LSALISLSNSTDGKTRLNKAKPYVAVVDDDESFACALERLFRASGFDVQTYPSAEAFLASPAPRRPDCLVLDIQLGGMSGLDLQRKLREGGGRQPIIFVTAHDEPKVRQEAERSGCSDYFLKPVPRKSIVEAIDKAVRLSNQSKDDK
jgi:FixJ family two-component response regulator